jgi:signal recognition particle subunit SRP14
MLWMQLTAKDHQRFQTSYATVLKAHMDALKKREKKDKKDKKVAPVKAPVS